MYAKVAQRMYAQVAQRMYAVVRRMNPPSALLLRHSSIEALLRLYEVPFEALSRPY
jgi:hypothetical protein